MSPMSLGSRLHCEMSVCPLCPREAVCTVRCPYVPYVPRTVTVRGHTDISMYEQLPGDIGDIRTSHGTNSFQGEIGDIRTSQCMNSLQGTKGTYRHLTVRTASRAHTDISMQERLPEEIRDIRTSQCTTGFLGIYRHLSV